MLTISVVTPVYNGERFIESCLQSVIAQRCPTVEHIVVDGGSTDRTVELIKAYADRYPHIRWISEKDQGQSDAMNKGIRMAKGTVLGILNVDDFYEPNALNRVLEIFATLPEPSFVVGNLNIWDDEGKIKFINKPKTLQFLPLVSWTSPIPYNPSAYFYHRSLHQKTGLYEVDEHYAMDLDFILKAVQVAHTYYFDQLWGNYRQIEGTKTVSSTYEDKAKYHRLKVLEKHRRSLPLPQQLWAVLGVAVISKVQHFLAHPNEIPLAIQARWYKFKAAVALR